LADRYTKGGLEYDLREKFLRIFEVKQVSFDDPDDRENAREQEVLFIDVTAYRPKYRDGVEHARVEGRGVIFANADKMPLGYLSKCISRHGELTQPFFFYDLEQTEKISSNIVARGFSFVYFFNSQYDPSLGIINDIETIEVNT